MKSDGRVITRDKQDGGGRSNARRPFVLLLMAILALAWLATPAAAIAEGRIGLATDPAQPVVGRDTRVRIRLVDADGAGIAGAIVQVFATAPGNQAAPMTGQPAIYLCACHYYTRVRFDQPGLWSLRVSYNEGFGVYGHEFPVAVATPPFWAEDGQRLPVLGGLVILAVAGGAYAARRQGRFPDYAVIVGLAALTLFVGWATLSYGRGAHADSPLAAKLQDPATSAH